MAMESRLLNPLLDQLWRSPVFGDSFAVTADRAVVASQMGVVLRDFSQEAGGYFAGGMPDMNERQVESLVRDMASVAVVFCSALSAGEITDTSRLSSLAVLIGLTGWGNRLCDRGDPAMPPAISRLCRREVEVPADLAKLVDARFGGLKQIERKIHQIARPEDRPYLLRASRDELMLNEVLAHELSLEYAAAADKEAFLAQHAERAARILTITAALPSAVTPLYSIYRHQDPGLPSLEEVYGEEEILKFLRVANTFIRVFDDLGDRDVDRRAFSLNIFNQAHPALIEAFCAQAEITEQADVNELQQAFAQADTDSETGRIADFFVGHIKRYVANLPPDILKRYAKYIQLGKRALEAGYVNQVGDARLTDPG